MSNKNLARFKDSFQINSHDLIPHVWTGLQKSCSRIDTSAIDQDLHPPLYLKRKLKQILERIPLGDIHKTVTDLVTEFSELFNTSPAGLFDEVSNDDMSTGPQNALTQGAAQLSCTTNDHRNLAVQAKQII